MKQILKKMKRYPKAYFEIWHQFHCTASNYVWNDLTTCMKILGFECFSNALLQYMLRQIKIIVLPNRKIHSSAIICHKIASILR